MKQPLLILLLVLFLQPLQLLAQLTASNKKSLDKQQDSLKYFADLMIDATDWEDRFVANESFTKKLVAALKTPYSFQYAFDSLETVSILYPPDTSFRIFTWQIVKDFSFCLQKGAIQTKTSNGELKLYPLFDVSSFTDNPVDSVRDHKNWIGAIYYKILQNKIGNDNVYTLLGYDDNNERTNKKWIEILRFDTAGMPLFGAKAFQYKNDGRKPPQPASRFLLEYKKDARVRLNYDEEAGMIIFDHLIPEDGDNENKTSYIPDGTYEGFKWQNNQWVHIPDIPYQKISLLGVDPLLGNAPVEDPLLDESGKPNQVKLDEQNRKNMQKNTDAKQPVTPKKKTEKNKQKSKS
ncbi:MAG: hypothetical protein ACOVNR_06065 [Chitinophagaceae bacterium]